MANERILAKGVSVSNDTARTMLNNNLIIGSAGAGKTGGGSSPPRETASGEPTVDALPLSNELAACANAIAVSRAKTMPAMSFRGSPKASRERHCVEQITPRAKREG